MCLPMMANMIHEGLSFLEAYYGRRAYLNDEAETPIMVNDKKTAVLHLFYSNDCIKAFQKLKNAVLSSAIILSHFRLSSNYPFATLWKVATPESCSGMTSWFVGGAIIPRSSAGADVDGNYTDPGRFSVAFSRMRKYMSLHVFYACLENNDAPRAQMWTSVKAMIDSKKNKYGEVIHIEKGYMSRAVLASLNTWFPRSALTFRDGFTKICSILENYVEIYVGRDGRHGVKRSRQRHNMTMLEKTQALPFEAAESFEALHAKVAEFDSMSATEEDVATCEYNTWHGPVSYTHLTLPTKRIV